MRNICGPLLVFSLIMIFTFPRFVLAAPENWSEVTRFEGSGTEQYNSPYFTCNHSEWRIRWNYTPVSPSNYSTFIVVTTPQDEIGWVSYIVKHENITTNGISQIHNKSGTFYSAINVANLESYSVIIEQDLDSIPEYPSAIILLAIILGVSIPFAVWKKTRKGRLGFQTNVG